ncbi:2-oxo-4-hydroxy-4-carboxy-5-ureidoimidazoline decarboxylase [Saccharopolyspora sp. HNM0983]|uniref:2-oxo-4-hydroxy-4-carboxy-5-ureidoimidazoline decarboxylase n=1 Tax=Saccharopolyspora montiporae TaxID=2781240 RepID=A0A929BBI5_9PSEU|nr:2-oxo-4-hydroxy-4-carboxy-5-ureidoimidazoline decarboxylase [Saccharopolyspora sp. HNM0983]MBE9375043.1 2-oxo-4-hydroxy-4-carboxy-5-ureidoimidazoline decarboxylase [Saccharopolyspora sp. HNM0983]
MPTPPSDTAAGPGGLNALPRAELLAQLRSCLDIPRWAEDIAAAAPFPDADAVQRAADAAAPELTEQEIHQALAAHPRIGSRPEGSGTEATWSRSEQSGVDSADADLAERLHRGNAAYEQRFGHVYLVCASGRSGAELLEILHARLDNDPADELRVVAGELREIARLRVARLIQR